MKKQSICLLIVAATLTGCVQIRVEEREAESPMVSFMLVTPTQAGIPLQALPVTPLPPPSPTPTTRSLPTTLPSSTPTALPTSTPPSTPTSTPLPCSPDARFLGDVTLPDDSVVMPGEVLVKVWRVQSSGCAPWPAGSRWVWVGGARMGAAEAVAVAGTPLGGAADISVTLVAPSSPGTYTGYWRMQAPDGSFFGEQTFVQIVVAAPTSTPAPAPPRPSRTPQPTATPDTSTPTAPPP